MLKKLLKYDLKKLLKFISIFYVLGLFFAVLTRLFFSFDNSLMINILGQITTGATIAMIANIIINCLMRSWVIFKQNLYGDESYLTHTLPVTKKTLYNSKIVSLILTMVVSFIFILFILFVAYYSKDNIIILKNLILSFANIFNGKELVFIFSIILVFLLEMLTIAQCGYTGIILGHKKNNNKVGYSVLFGFISYMITQMVVLLFLFIIALFNKDVMNIFMTNDVVNMGAFKNLLYGSIFIYSGCFIIWSFVNVKLFNKGVDVE